VDEEVSRWIHKEVARALNVSEDVVRRIYAAVQTAKRQSLHGGHMVDLVERSVGRKLIGDEYAVATRAKEYLGYSPPGGYGGPKPSGAAKEPLRARYDDPKVQKAAWIAAGADRIIKNLARPNLTLVPLDYDLLRGAADELEVAADLYEEAGARVRAGTLRERARLARRGATKLLATYD
jgi:hypothetical protein